MASIASRSNQTRKLFQLPRHRIMPSAKLILNSISILLSFHNYLSVPYTRAMSFFWCKASRHMLLGNKIPQTYGENDWDSNTSLSNSNDFVQPNVQIRRYRNEERDRMMPNSFEDSLLMGFNGLRRFVWVVPYVKNVDDWINRPRCYVQAIRWPSLVYESWLWVTTFLLPPKGLNLCLPQSIIK